MTAKVVSGEVFGVKGPIVARTPTYYIDFIFEKENTSYTHVIPQGWNSMIVLFQGSISVQNDAQVFQGIHGIVFEATESADEEIKITTKSPNTRFLLLAGKPLNEPIANYGPFVLNTREELQQAFDDF